MKRKISFAQAKRQYPHRFTMEHLPEWAKQIRPGWYVLRSALSFG